MKVNVTQLISQSLELIKWVIILVIVALIAAMFGVDTVIIDAISPWSGEETVVAPIEQLCESSWWNPFAEACEAAE